MYVYNVEKVIDGDTFEVSPTETVMRFSSQENRSFLEHIKMLPLLPETAIQRMEKLRGFEKVRLANITPPEKGTPEDEKAARYLKELIEGKWVTLLPIEISDDRVVAYVWRYPTHFFINAVMVYRGHANWATVPTGRKRNVSSK